MKVTSEENNMLLASQWTDSAFAPDKSAPSANFSKTVNLWKAAYVKAQEPTGKEASPGKRAVMQDDNATALQEQALLSKNEDRHTEQKETGYGEKHHRSEEKTIADDALAQTPLPSPLAAPMPRAENSPDVTRPTLDQQELTELLQSVCSKLYVAQSGMHAGKEHVMLDVGSMLPGSMVEMTRNGVFLHVRLHAADRKALQILERSGDRLMEILSKSTDLMVRLDMVSRDEPSAF